MCFYDDGEQARCWNDDFRRARKAHRCDICRQSIGAGEIYIHSSGIGWDGDPFAEKQCGRCSLYRYLFHVIELYKGCRDRESWCPLYSLAEVIDEEWDAAPVTIEEGQRYMERVRRVGSIRITRPERPRPPRRRKVCHA